MKRMLLGFCFGKMTLVKRHWTCRPHHTLAAELIRSVVISIVAISNQHNSCWGEGLAAQQHIGCTAAILDGDKLIVNVETKTLQKYLTSKKLLKRGNNGTAYIF